MKLKKAYLSAADESDFGVERIRPFDFWFEFIVNGRTITRENYYDAHSYYSPHWRGINFLVQPIYIGHVNNFPQEAMTERVSNVFSKIADYKNPVAVIDNQVYSATAPYETDSWSYDNRYDSSNECAVLGSAK